LEVAITQVIGAVHGPGAEGINPHSLSLGSGRRKSC
jgi:hypothetical protein